MCRILIDGVRRRHGFLRHRLTCTVTQGLAAVGQIAMPYRAGHIPAAADDAPVRKQADLRPSATCADKDVSYRVDSSQAG